MFSFLTGINELDWANLTEDDYEIKFFLWSRKIEDHIIWLEDQNFSEDTICYYLEKCACLRDKFLDPKDLTSTEVYYMEKIQHLWEKYKRTDPIWEIFKDL